MFDIFSAIFVTIVPTVFLLVLSLLQVSTAHPALKKYDELVTLQNVHIAHRYRTNCTDSQLTLKSYEKTICFN
jgi:hypothetical protein